MDTPRSTRLFQNAKRLLVLARRLAYAARGRGLPVEESYRAAWNAAARRDAFTAILTPPDRSTGVEGEFDRQGRLDAEWLRRFVTPESIVLDIGCGIGRIERHLAPYCARICAADVSDEMIKAARRWAAGLPNIEFYRASATDLSIFPSAMFDFVFSYLVLQHLEYEDAFLALREVSRVLKRGGRAVLQFPSLASPLYAAEFVRQANLRARHSARIRAYSADFAASLLALAALELERLETPPGGTLTEHEIVAIVRRRPDPPAISDFHIRPLTPEQSGIAVRWSITATVTDVNNDIVGGRAEIRVVGTGEEFTLPIRKQDLVGGALAAVFSLVDPPGGRIDAVFSVLDVTSERSREIPFYLTIAGPQQGGTPGRLEGGMSPGRVTDRAGRHR